MALAACRRPQTQGSINFIFNHGSNKVIQHGSQMTCVWSNCLAEWCLQETQPQGSLDKNDPNYDSEEDKTVSYHSQKTLQIKLYKKAVGFVRAVQHGVGP